MEGSEIGDRLQLIGTFGVIASLIFVGLEIKQSREIAESAAYQARTDTAIELAGSAASSPQFLSGSAKIWANNANELTGEEYEAILWIFSGSMDIFENVYFQYESGFLDDAYWAKARGQLKCWMQHPFYNKISDGNVRREAFGAELRQIKIDAIKNPSECWVEQ